MLSDWKHWRTVGLALLVGACGALTNRAHAQGPAGPTDAPRSMAFPGPAPMGCDSSSSCDSQGEYGQGLFGTGVLRGPFGGMFGGRMFGSSGAMPSMCGPGGSMCGPGGCGPGGCGPMAGLGMGYGPAGYGAMPYFGPMGGYVEDDGFLGSGPLSRLCSGGGDGMGGYCGPAGRCGCVGCGPLGCSHFGGGIFGGAGCCGLGCLGGDGALFSGHILKHLLGPLAPYSEGAGTQRWFDVYAGTIAMARSTSVGGVASPIQNLASTTADFETTDLISTIGTGTGNPALRTSGLSLDKLRYGLELVGNIQTGPGANIEVRYFGLNNWNDTLSIQRSDPDLFSIFSVYGTDPFDGFDDTDRSFIHTISYDSGFDNGEVNYRRRWVGSNSAIQGSWLAGVRYFELDERFGFAAVGSNDDTFTFDQLRFFNMDTRTRNNMFGFQLGADFWVNLIPGLALGNDFRAGVYNNQAKVETLVVANSVPGASEVLRKESAAFLLEYSASLVYRLTHSWAVRSSVNMMYVDQVALAPTNFNTRGMANALASDVFSLDRYPFIDADGNAFYYGYSIGAEFLW
jgi:hypothetical protein